MIAAVFFVVIMVLSLNLVLFALSQYDRYVVMGVDRSTYDWERSSEHLLIVEARVNNQKLNATVQNAGKLPLHIVSVWVTEWDQTTANWHREFPTNTYLSPGQTITNLGQTFSQTLDIRRVYQVKMVTGRGNAASVTFVPLQTTSSPAYINTGYLTISFSEEAFRYTKPNDPTLRSAWNVPYTDSCVLWWVQLTNHGSEDITLYYWSVLSFVQAATSVVQRLFFIVHPSATLSGGGGCPSYITPYSKYYPSQTIPKNPLGDAETGGTPTWAKFSATTPGGSNPRIVSWGANTHYTLFIVLFYRYGCECGDENYTQVIPLAGVHFV
jgi:hypothetical protein